MGVIVNTDYSIGADKGGAVNMFDIDYNTQKYLIGHCSGALVKPFSAIALELAVDDSRLINKEKSKWQNFWNNRLLCNKRDQPRSMGGGLPSVATTAIWFEIFRRLSPRMT